MGVNWFAAAQDIEIYCKQIFVGVILVEDRELAVMCIPLNAFGSAVGTLGSGADDDEGVFRSACSQRPNIISVGKA